MEIPYHWCHRWICTYRGSKTSDVNLLTSEVKYYIMTNNELHRHKIHFSDFTDLGNYTKKGDFLWNFSCPFCGDSQKNRKNTKRFRL